MPLNETCSREAFEENIRRLIDEGKDRDQAVAIAASVMKKACGPQRAQQLMSEHAERVAMLLSDAEREIVDNVTRGNPHLRVQAFSSLTDQVQKRGNDGRWST